MACHGNAASDKGPLGWPTTVQEGSGGGAFEQRGYGTMSTRHLSTYTDTCVLHLRARVGWEFQDHPHKYKRLWIEDSTGSLGALDIVSFCDLVALRLVSLSAFRTY